MWFVRPLFTQNRYRLRCDSKAPPYPGQGSGAGMNRALPDGVKNRPSSCRRTVPEGVRFTSRTGVWIPSLPSLRSRS